MEIGFDVISNLQHFTGDSFDWTNKPTSLYCIVAGNISANPVVVHRILMKLSKVYQGVFYIGGELELTVNPDLQTSTALLKKICDGFKNVVYLYQHVVIIDGIAILGITGWYGKSSNEPVRNILYEHYRFDDLNYLNQSIGKLQLHQDVKKIIIVTNSVPNEALFFGNTPEDVSSHIPITYTLDADTERKVSHWVFDGAPQTSVTSENIEYVSNGYGEQNSPYWAKRINVRV